MQFSSSLKLWNKPYMNKNGGRMWGLGLVGEGTCSFPLHPGSSPIVYVFHSAVSYLSIDLAGYLVGLGISCGACKLAPVIKKKKKDSL